MQVSHEQAWLAAQSVIAQREKKQFDSERADLLNQLAQATVENTRQQRKLVAAQASLVQVAKEPVRRAHGNLDGINAQVQSLAGPVSEKSASVRLDVTGLSKLMLLGRLRDGQGETPKHRETLVAFHFLDQNGSPLPTPDWALESTIFGSYRYLDVDAGGWFTQAISLPQGTAVLALAVHDFRRHVHGSGHDISDPFVLEYPECVGMDLPTRSMLTSVAKEHRATLTEDGVLQVDSDGVSTAIVFDSPRQTAHFVLQALPVDTGNTGFTVHTKARCEDQSVIQTTSHVTDGTQVDFQIALNSPSPFSQLIVRIVADSPARPLLLLDKTLDDADTYPDPDLLKKLNSPSISVDFLERMASDWEQRKSWFCVTGDLTSFDGTLALVQRLEASPESLAFKFSFRGTPEEVVRKKGVVLSLFYFDKDGASIPLSASGFAHSPHVGLYKYIPSGPQHCESTTILPVPQTGLPAYVAVCVQKWDARAFSRVSGTPLLAPMHTMSQLIEDAMMAPERTGAPASAGVFTRGVRNAQRPLLPNSWRSKISKETREIIIRLGTEDRGCLWGNIADFPNYPGTLKLREVLIEAHRRGIPILVDASRVQGDTLPLLLMGKASKVIARQDQYERLSRSISPAKITLSP